MAVAVKRLSQTTTVGVAAPIITAVANSSTAGTLTLLSSAGYKVTATNAAGESSPSAEVTGTLTGTNQSFNVQWATSVGATGYKVYGRTVGGPWLLIATVAAPTVNYVDTGSVTPAGAIPVTNTTGPVASFTATTKSAIKQAVFANPTAAAALVYLSLHPVGSNIDGTHYLVPGFSVPPNDSLVFDCLQVLAATDFLVAWSSTAGVVITCSGMDGLP